MYEREREGTCPYRPPAVAVPMMVIWRMNVMTISQTQALKSLVAPTGLFSMTLASTP